MLHWCRARMEPQGTASTDCPSCFMRARLAPTMRRLIPNRHRKRRMLFLVFWFLLRRSSVRGEEAAPCPCGGGGGGGTIALSHHDEKAGASFRPCYCECSCLERVCCVPRLEKLSAIHVLLWALPRVLGDFSENESGKYENRPDLPPSYSFETRTVIGATARGKRRKAVLVPPQRTPLCEDM